jgi:beta-glucosidase
MYKLRMFDRERISCSPPHCQGWLRRNVTGIEHRAIARQGAAASIVLLQNNGSILPLTTAAAKPYTIAVLGGAAEAKVFDANLPGNGWCTNRKGQPGGDITCGGDYYSGGGSGHVTPAIYVTPLDGIKNRASVGPTLVTVKSHSKGSSNQPDAENLALAKAADTTIIFCGTSTGESADRQSLSLDADCDGFISSVAQVSRRVVVLVMTPGAFLTPWRSEVSAIATMFLGGQETGDAWADVVFGDVSPAGRLPIELPDTEADTIEPNPAPFFPYTEGLQTSYRNTTARRAYPFGHGMSFSTFQWSGVTSTTCPTATPVWEVCLKMTVTNNGIRAATDTPQLYLEFPPEARQPRSILKGFQKTPLLQSMESATVTFNLTARDLSYYVPQSKSWVKADVTKVGYEMSKSSEVVVMTGKLGEL